MQYWNYVSVANDFFILMIFNTAMSTIGLIWNQMRWEDDFEWRVGKNFEEGNHGLFSGHSIILERLKKIMKVSVRKSLVNIQARYIPNTNQSVTDAQIC
jgi:hypothetical protein